MPCYPFFCWYLNNIIYFIVLIYHHMTSIFGQWDLVTKNWLGNLSQSEIEKPRMNTNSWHHSQPHHAWGELENWEQQRWTSMIGREDSYNLSWYPTKLTITNSSNNSLLIITLNSPTYGHLISTRESLVCSIGYTKVAKGFSLMGDGPQIYYDWDMWRGPN